MELSQESNNEQLHEAAFIGNETRVIELLKQNHNINISYKSNKTGRTALAAAVKGGYCRIVSVLLKKGADPNEIINEDGILKSLLYLATAANHIAIVKLLVRFKATIKPNDNNWSRYELFRSVDRKMAYQLSIADPTNCIMEQLKTSAREGSYYGNYVHMFKVLSLEKEKYSNVLYQLLTRIKDLQDELSDVGNIIQMATDRVNLEVQLQTALNVPATLKDYSKIAQLGVQLVNLEKSAAYYCLLEEDCAALPAKYHAVLADIVSIYKPLEDTHQFVFLKDFIDLYTALKAVDLTPLEIALKDGLLRPTIQLSPPSQQHLQQKQGIHIKQERI